MNEVNSVKEVIIQKPFPLSDEQKDNFIEERKELIKDKMTAIKGKIEEEEKSKAEINYKHLYTYLENHFKAEMTWLKSLK